jgi:hypothetical protein
MLADVVAVGLARPQKEAKVQGWDGSMEANTGRLGRPVRRASCPGWQFSAMHVYSTAVSSSKLRGSRAIPARIL